MATFAKQTFNAASYAAIRPTYPQVLYEAVYGFHKGGWGRAVDLGCGTGQVAEALVGFEEVVGVDGAKGMIEVGRGKEGAGTSVRYVESEAERLEFLEDKSVDLVVSGQAAHWFDWGRLWAEVGRVLRADGTVAFWGYSQFRIRGHPELTGLIHEYSQGPDALGPYWEQPGRRILDNHFLDIPRAPDLLFSGHRHLFYTSDYYPHLHQPQDTILRKKVSWPGLQAYLRTFSALHNFHAAHPEDAARRTGLALRPTDGAGGDIVERFWWKLQEEVAATMATTATTTTTTTDIEIEWPLTLVMYRRRA